MENKGKSLERQVQCEIRVKEIKSYDFNALTIYSKTYSSNMVIKCIYIIESWINAIKCVNHFFEFGIHCNLIF